VLHAHKSQGNCPPKTGPNLAKPAANIKYAIEHR